MTHLSHRKSPSPGDRVNDQMLFFNYATGFRPGNVNNGQVFNAREFTAAGFPQDLIDRVNSVVTYDGDEVSNYELGAKLLLADGKVQIVTSLYYLDWADTILYFQDPLIPSLNSNYNLNAGAAHSQGVELELTWVPLDRLKLRLAGDLNEAELDEDVVSTSTPDQIRQQDVLRPRMESGTQCRLHDESVGQL